MLVKKSHNIKRSTIVKKQVKTTYTNFILLENPKVTQSNKYNSYKKIKQLG